ncbi:hypothetical protein [Aliivibrio fischeri]|uniref:Uncharacterized protein n=1 Tax=Aliivibrio fischeri TaxID=668 RepID=A0A510US10_ALIFS|nr:hypothetical protein [Aliivibrio fischeri]GEK16261.1 hypothetical protein AFI02nite_42970 [Aliivibrio fischeri]
MKISDKHCQQCGVLLPQEQFAFSLTIQTQTVAASKTKLSTSLPLPHDKLLCPTCASITFIKE